eukprot:6202590-Pleurochrysis_carterae.AAC.2
MPRPRRGKIVCKHARERHSCAAAHLLVDRLQQVELRACAQRRRFRTRCALKHVETFASHFGKLPQDLHVGPTLYRSSLNGHQWGWNAMTRACKSTNLGLARSIAHLEHIQVHECTSTKYHGVFWPYSALHRLSSIGRTRFSRNWDNWHKDRGRVQSNAC